ncbi:uncharacterized protein LOC111337534 [Stylophora pistillata]|uniref:uncharacterized protein LOC111337534 n=1 Tax=Stylophora pistillata TaxID=50429 RepID=UPI000C040F3F|nr:uncharacterized protein LOC111337534 [Stylophora pistillata]
MEKQAPAIVSRCLIYLLVCVLTVSSVATDSPIYVSLTTGKDSRRCGQLKVPCKTLEHSLERVTDGGSLFLDGTDSRDNPYKCGPGTRTIIGKNLRISSWFARAHISCEIRFKLTLPGRTGMRATSSSRSYPSPFTNDGLETKSGLTVTIRDLSFVQSGVTVACSETKCYVEVEHSLFEQGGLTCMGLCSLNVGNSTFANPTRAHVQFGVFCYGAIGCCLEVANTLFVQASLICNGSCFMKVSNSNFNDSTVTVSRNVNAGKDANMTSIAIAHSNFIRNRSQSLIKFHCHLGFELKIYQCNFRDDHWLSDPDTLVDLHSSPPSVDRVRVAFDRNNFTAIAGPAFNLRGCFDSISFVDMSMIGMKSFAIKVDDTHHNCQPRNVTVHMNNCLFNGTLQSVNPHTAVIDIEAREVTILMNYMQFHFNNRSLILFSSKKGSLTINNSDFAYNSIRDCDNVYPLLFSKKYKFEKLTNSPEIKKQERDSVVGSMVLNIQNTKFSLNIVPSSVITLSQTSATFSNVTFINNTVDGLGGDIRIKDQSLVSLSSCQFERYSHHYFASAFVYSEVNSNATVNITNCRFKSDVEVDASIIFFLRSGIRLYADKQSNITCPLGYFLELNPPNVSLSGSPTEDTYNPTCKKCSVGLYNLQRVYVIPDSSVNEKCIPCPYGGNCTHGIEAKPNFWGYLEPEDHRPTVKFEICPLGYCEPSPGSFNSCHGYRNGFLCGQCREGYTEAMFSSECQEEENCHNNWFWFFSFLYVACLSFLLITRPCIFQILWRNAVWFRPKNHERQSSQSFQSAEGEHCNG